jgi:hypothetical protein
LVKTLPLARKELSVDCLTNQGVPERESLGRFFDDQLRRDQLFELVEKKRFSLAGEITQGDEVEAPPGNRGQGEHLL